MKRYILIILIIFSENCLYAQNQDSSDTLMNNSTVSPVKIRIVKAFFQDEVKLWTSPVKKPDKSKIFWVPVFGAAIFALSRDEKIYSDFKSFQSKHKWVSSLSPVITHGGDNITVLSTCALFYFGGLAFHNDKAGQTGLMSAEALAHAGLFVNLGKIITGRQRPSYDQGKDHWNWFPASLNGFKKGNLKSGYDAFPSGHTIAAWSVATVIAKQYKDVKIIPVLCYSLATGVGLSRITEDTHWMSDVIIGGALGYSIGRFVVRERVNNRFTLLPFADGKSLLIHASITL